MPSFEYSRYDGSEQFSPQSADEIFDQFSQYLMSYGEDMLDELDTDPVGGEFTHSTLQMVAAAAARDAVPTLRLEQVKERLSSLEADLELDRALVREAQIAFAQRLHRAESNHDQARRGSFDSEF